MLAAQTPGLWQSQLASLAAKMNSEQAAADSSAGMDAVALFPSMTGRRTAGIVRKRESL